MWSYERISTFYSWLLRFSCLSLTVLPSLRFRLTFPPFFFSSLLFHLRSSPSHLLFISYSFLFLFIIIMLFSSLSLLLASFSPLPPSSPSSFSSSPPPPLPVPRCDRCCDGRGRRRRRGCRVSRFPALDLQPRCSHQSTTSDFRLAAETWCAFNSV